MVLMSSLSRFYCIFFFVLGFKGFYGFASDILLYRKMVSVNDCYVINPA